MGKPERHRWWRRQSYGSEGEDLGDVLRGLFERFTVPDLVGLPELEAANDTVAALGPGGLLDTKGGRAGAGATGGGFEGSDHDGQVVARDAQIRA
jgi:hypothetical protein